MDAMQIYKTEITEPAEITTDLFRQFVDWIDGTEATTRAYLANLRQFARYMKEAGVKQPTRETVKAYRDYLTGKGLKASTITAYLRSVKQFFAWTAAAGLYPDVAANIHAPKVDHSMHKKDALERGDVMAIEQSIEKEAAEKTAAAAGKEKDRAGRVQRSDIQGKRLKAIYLLAVEAGLRTVEISRADVKDLEKKGGQAWLYVWGKGRSEADQKKALAPAVYDAIREYLDARADHFTGASPLFVATGNRSAGKRLASTTVSTMLKRAMQAAGYDSDRLTAHSLRHTAGTAAMQCTGDLYATQAYMRHASPATTEIYLHVDTEKKDAETADRLDAYYRGGTPDPAEPLPAILDNLTPEQIKQLAEMAAAMPA